MSKARGRSLLSVSSLALVWLLLAASQPVASLSAKFTAVASPKNPKAQATSYVEDELLVRFRRGVNKKEVKNVHAKFRARSVRDYKGVPGLQRIRLPKGKGIKQALKEYQSNPNILYAEPNYIYHGDAAPNDPEFSNLWGLRNTGQSGGVTDADINALEAWESGVTGNANFVIAVIDSGIDYSHEDLAPNMWSNPGETAGNGIDDDGNGYIDDIHGIDAVNNDSDPMDDHGHGTHVAGTIAAKGNNAIGVVGVNWNASLLSCKYLNSDNNGTTSNALECLSYLLALKTRAQNPVNIILSNNSWGGNGYSQALRDLIAAHRDAGILFVSSAGNNSSDNDTVPYYPASYQLSNMIVVAATDHNDSLGNFSNTGRRSVHVAAPGVNVFSSLPGGDNYVPQPGDIFYDDVEGGNIGWSPESPWAISTDKAYSPNNAWTDSPGGNYSRNTHVSLISPVIDLSQTTGTPLAMGFWAWPDLEQDYDNVYVEATNNGFATSTPLLGAPINGRIRQWQRYNFSIPDNSILRHSNFQFRFRFVADSRTHYDGIYVDDIGIGDLTGVPSNRYDYYSGTSMAVPHVSGLIGLLKAQDTTRNWAELKNLVLAGGEIKPATQNTTITGRRIRAWDNDGDGSLSCNSSVVLERVWPLTDYTFAAVGEAVGMSILHINCERGNGILSAMTSGPTGAGEVFFTDDGAGFDEQAGDGIYSAQWVPTEAGLYTINYPDGSAVTIDVLANYQAALELPFEYRDITAVGTNLNLGDDAVVVITSPFPIHYGEHSNGFSQLTVSSNGIVSFHDLSNSHFSNQQLPSVVSRSIVAPLWTDLNPTVGGGVYWATQGLAPNRELIVEWRDVPHYPAIGDARFQVVFLENSSDVLFNYTDVLFGDTSHDYGASATVGMQVGEDAAQQYSYNSATLRDGLTLQWKVVVFNNTPPTITAPADQTITANSTITNLEFTIGDNETAADQLTVVASSSNTTLLPNNNIVLGGSGSNRTISLTPAADQTGVSVVTLTVNDGTDSTSASFQLTVVPGNAAPLALDQSITTDEDTAVAIILSASDADADTLTYTVVDQPTHGMLSGTAPNLTYTPDADYFGSDSFTFKANDGTVDSNVATVSITVTAVNDAAVAQDQSVSTNEDTALAITLVATDVDGDTLAYATVGQPTHGTLSGTAPNLTYTPDADYFGSDSFTFQANDGTVDSNVATVSITVTTVNDVPVAEAQSVTTTEDTAVVIGLVATDADGDALTYSITSPPTHGTLSGTGSNLTYTPGPDYFGADSFGFIASDGLQNSPVATVDITVTAVNDGPLADDLTLSTAEDTALNISLTASDVDGDTLSYTVVDQPTHGTLSGTAPNLTYTPDGDYSGADSLTFLANDGALDSNVATVSITVTAVNDAPIAQDGVLTAAEDGTALASLVATDNEGDALSFSIVSNAAHGTVVITDSTTGAYRYTPDADYFGSDSFTFKANDGVVDSNVATVSITVTAVNDAPVSVDQSLTVAEDSQFNAVLLEVTDIDGDTLTYTVVSQPTHGTLSGTAPNLVYEPEADYFGSDSFTFKANDSTVDSAIATVSITVTAVNDVPVAEAQSVTTTEDTALAIVLSGSDIDGDSLSYRVVGQPTHGTLSGTGPNLTYTPEADYFGADSFGFVVNDGTVDSVTATVSITITAVNDAPVAQGQSVTTNEDTVLVITLVATDVDGDTLTYTVMDLPTHGTLSGTAPNLTYTPAENYAGADSFTFKANDGTLDSNVATVSITVTAVNDAPVAQDQSVSTNEDTALVIGLVATDAEGDSLTYVVVSAPTHGTLSGSAPNLTYTPNADYNGSDSLTFKANDGVTDSNVATVNITVTAVNDAPVAQSQSVNTNEDTALAISLVGTDDDGDGLTYTVVSLPTHGTLSGTAPNLTYTPEADYSGNDSFGFVVNDGTVDSAIATVSITVTAVNDAPVAQDQSVSTNEDTALVIGLVATDTEGDGLTYAVVSAPTHGTLTGTAPNLTYTPNADYNGSDSFTFKANDGTADSNIATVSITVTAVNDAPVAQGQNLTTAEDTVLDVVIVGTDVDGDSLSYRVVGQPTHGTLSGTAPNLSYTPDTNFVGADSFSFVVNDGTVDSAAATINITVTAVNDVPVAQNQNLSTAEDTVLAIVLNASDDDGDSPTYTVVSQPSHGTLNGTAPNLSYIPNADYNGSDSFTFKANDGTADSNIATVSITITAVNDAPVAQEQALVTDEEQSLGVVLSATDVDGDSLSYSVVGQPSHGMLSGTAPNLTYTPDVDYAGNDSFAFIANDGLLSSTPATISITINPINDAPVATAQAVTTAEDTPVNIVLSGSDADGDTLSYRISTAPTHGVLSGSAPNLTYTPNTDYSGSDSFEFVVNDDTVDSVPAAVTITINPMSDSPIAEGQSVSTAEDTALAITLTGSDPDMDTLTFTIATAPTHGTLSGTAPDIIYTPAENYFGNDSFSFTVSDGSNVSAPANVNITITAVNDAPIAQDGTLVIDEDSLNATLILVASDVDGDSLSYTVVDAPSHGTLSGTAPNLAYTPAANYFGNDSLTFQVNDGSVDSNVATVSITITAVNDAPVAQAQSVTTAEDTALSIILAGTDVDGDGLSYRVVSQPTHGTLSGTAPNLSYIPNADYIGNDSFDFVVNDGTVDSALAVITINVTAANDAPVAQDQSVSTAEDTALAITLAATDVDGDALSYAVETQPTHGTLSGTAPNLTYTPNADYNGNDSFTFKANDGVVDSNVATVNITITAVNDAPVAQNQTVSTAEDTALAITLAATDVDGDSLSYAIVSGPAHGTLSGTAPNLTFTPDADFIGADSFTFKANDGAVDSNIATVSISITAANDAPVAQDLNVTTAEDTAVAIDLVATDVDGDSLDYAIVSGPAHGTLSGTAPNLTYTPEADYNGNDSFTFKANDGALDSNIATVSITVTAANDAPVAQDQSVSTAEDTALTITLTATDVDGDSLDYAIVSGPAHGTLSGTAPNLSYTPDADFIGADSFSFKANDGTVDSNIATVSIDVTAANDAPVAQDQSVSTAEDTALTITLVATDVDGGSLDYAIVSGPAHGTLSGTAPNLTYTPEADYNGNDSFTFQANDGSVDSNIAAVSITITAVNDAPVAEDQGVTTVENTALDIVLNATDIDGDSLTYAAVSQPSHGTLSGTAPNLTYTPEENYFGADSFTFQANDGALDSNIATVSINVTAVNDAPVAQDQSVTTNEDTAVAIDLVANDIDGDTLTYVVVNQPAHGTLSGTAPNLTYTPAENYSGADSFTFQVNDGALDSNVATVSITVTAVNDAPVAQEQSVTVNEDAAVAITLVATDVDGDSLTYIVVSQPVHGTLGGTVPNLTYTPSAGYTGNDSFTFKVNDGSVDSNLATVSITVTPVNDAPVAQDQKLSVDEDSKNNPVKLMATDADDDSLTYSIVTVPAHGTLTGKLPNLKYNPADNYFGEDSFTFKANDGALDSNVATVTITIIGVNDGPVAYNQDITVAQDSSDNPIMLNVADADGDPLSFTIVSSVSHGTLSGKAPDLRYTPAPGYSGKDDFSYRVNDGVLNSKLATVKITISKSGIPVAQDIEVTVDEDSVDNPITLLVTDSDNDPLSYTVLKKPTHGALTGVAPDLLYTPEANYYGSDSFTYRASDGNHNSNTATVTITVLPVNDAPTAPQLINPAQDAKRVRFDSVTFRWHPGLDVDGDEITHDLYYCDNENFTGCKPVTVVSLDNPIVLAGAGGGLGVMLLGLVAMGQRRRRIMIGILLLFAVLHLTACGGAVAVGAAVPAAKSIMAQLVPRSLISNRILSTTGRLSPTTVMAAARRARSGVLLPVNNRAVRPYSIPCQHTVQSYPQKTVFLINS